MLHIILPLVLLVVTIVVVIILFSKPSSSDCKFLYKPSIYLQQGADPNFTLYPVLYKVVNNAGRYFIVKVYFKTKDCWYSVMLWNWWSWDWWKNLVLLKKLKSLTHFTPMFHYNTPRKRLNQRFSLRLSGV